MADIVLTCDINYSDITTVSVSLNTDISDTQAELMVGSSNLGNPSTVNATNAQWHCIELEDQGGSLEIRISNLNVDTAQAALAVDHIVASVSLIGGPLVSNNVLTVANLNSCEYSLSPSSALFGAEGGAGVLNVTAPAGCAWQATASESWIGITSGASGSGPGQIAYQTSANDLGLARHGAIAVQGQLAEIRQDPAVQKPELTITSFRAQPEGVSATSIPGASVAVRNSGQGPAEPFRVAFYYSRDESVTTADRFSGTICSFETLDLFQEAACETDIAMAPRLTPGTYYLGAILDDNRKIDEIDEANNVRVNDLGPVEIPDETPVPTPPTAVTNAATFEPGAAPGLFVAIFGDGWSEEPILADGLPFPTELEGYSVHVNGAPIPLSTVSKTQINAILPFDLPVGSTVEVQVVRDSEESEPFSIDIQPAMPGILTVTQDGTGQGAVLGSDYQLADEANPVQPGQSILIYCVGLGLVDPPIEAGNPADAATPLHRTIAEVRATVGGLPAEVSFSGLAPNFSGLYQVNATLPPGLPAGPATPLQLEVVLENGDTVESNVVSIAVGTEAP